jgi:hypothetical protein
MLQQHMRNLRPLIFLALVLLLGLGKNVSAALPNETPVADPVYGDPFGAQSRLAIATDGREFLAVWNDHRSRHTDGSVIATRLDRDGNSLDPHNIFISRGPVSSLAVVWNGTSYTIVWGTLEGAVPNGIHAVRVSREGRVIGEERIVYADGSFLAQSIASNGSRTLIGLQTPEGENHALLIDDALNVLADVTLPETPRENYFPMVAANGTHFAAIWTSRLSTDNASIVGVRISFSGTLLDTEPVPLGAGTALGLASDGTNFVALSHVPGAFATFAIPANLQNPAVARVLPDPNAWESLRLLYTGDRYIAIGPRYKSGELRLVVVEIDSAGVPGSADVLDTTPSYQYAASSIGGELLVLWTRTIDPYNATNTRLFARNFSGDPLEPDTAEKLLSSSAVWQEWPSIATNGSGYVVAWSQEDGVYAARLRHDGVSLDGPGIRLSKERFAGFPRVTWDGIQYIVAFSERPLSEYVSVLRFITPAQGLLEDRVVNAGHPLATGPDGVTLLANGNHVRRFFGATRTYENALVQVVPTSERASGLRAAWNGSEYLVAWTEEMLDPNSWQFDFYIGRRIRGVRVSRDLTVINPAPKTIGDIEDAIDTLTGIASDGTDWLVTWETDFNYVRAQRVLANGTLGTNTQGFLIAAGFGSAVTFDGARYVLAWKGGLPYADYPDEHQPLMAGYVTRAGALAAVTTFEPTEMPTSTAITRAPFGAVIAYARLDASTGGSPRVFVRGVESIAGRRRAVR